MAKCPTITYELPWPLTREQLNVYRDRYGLLGTHEVACLGETIMPDGRIISAPGNAQQPLQPDNGYVCNRPGQCAKGQGGNCYSGFDCPDKAIAG